VVVIVDILDISEHPPVFLMSNYTAVVYENSAIGTIVLVVGTNDRDTVRRIHPKFLPLMDLTSSLIVIAPAYCRINNLVLKII
jgi:hypothetical protein